MARKKEKIDNIALPDISARGARMMDKLVMARHFAERTRHWIEMIPTIPQWEALAEDEIKVALSELKSIEAILTESLVKYRSKPKGD